MTELPALTDPQGVMLLIGLVLLLGLLAVRRHLQISEQVTPVDPPGSCSDLSRGRRGGAGALPRTRPPSGPARCGRAVDGHAGAGGNSGRPGLNVPRPGRPEGPPMSIDELMRNNARVRAVYAAGPGVHVEGRIIGYREHPSVVIETDAGERVSWAAHLIEPTETKDPAMTADLHAVSIEPTEFTGPGGLPARGFVTVSCPTCGSSGPWTREEADVWREGHDTAVEAAAVAVEAAGAR